MREPFWARVRQWICRRFGHREEHDDYVVWCTRCGLLLKQYVPPEPPRA